MNLLPTSLFTERLIRCCSTPQSSGNSARIVRAPSETSRSDVWPIAGFAERPEKPSDPPHFNPTQRGDKSTGSRLAELASTNPSNVAAIALETMTNLELLLVCSKN